MSAVDSFRNPPVRDRAAGLSARDDIYMSWNILVTRICTALTVASIAHHLRAADADLAPIKTEVTKRHDEAVKRLQDWIKLPSIAAEDLNSAEGAEYMARLAKDAGFQQVTVIYGWEAGHVCDARCGRRQDGGALFHV